MRLCVELLTVEDAQGLLMSKDGEKKKDFRLSGFMFIVRNHGTLEDDNEATIYWKLFKRSYLDFSRIIIILFWYQVERNVDAWILENFLMVHDNKTLDDRKVRNVKLNCGRSNKYVNDILIEIF